MDLADSRQRTSPPQGWDSCSSLLLTGHKMFRNLYQTKSVKGVGPVDMDKVGHSLGLKVLGDHRPGGDHLVHLQRSFCRFWGRNMLFFFHFFFSPGTCSLSPPQRTLHWSLSRSARGWNICFPSQIIFCKKNLVRPSLLDEPDPNASSAYCPSHLTIDYIGT